MPDPALTTTIENHLNQPDFQNALRHLFCEELNWGVTHTAPFQRRIGSPVGQPLIFIPIAQLSGLPVFFCRWGGTKLPGITQRRAVHRALESTFSEHLLVYQTENRQVAFVWAKLRKDHQTELRTLTWQPGLPARTTLERLQELHFSIEELGLLGDPGMTRVMDQLNAAFSIEAVTKQFFQRYRELFEEVEAQLITPQPISPGQRRLFTQRFFNRLMFLMFLERKGWLSYKGQKNYLRILYADYAQHETDKLGGTGFHRSRLNTLFFNTLNNTDGRSRIGDKNYAPLREKVGDAPYLNGGLFEEEEGDNLWFFPDSAVQKILTDLFYAYNFTISESTPLDIEVAVDPEMLGRIFEELVTGRHETGSYYTPKPVVAFMCRETLKHHLQDVCPAETTPALEQFVENRLPDGLRNPEKVLEALRSVKICDPACGSGAYLLGMLHELLDLREALFASRQLGAETLYERKLEIIQNNLYGVDIDPFAVNIARLRLWLSLVVDDPRSPLEQPDLDVSLPNLDFKIGVGDSLTAPDPSSGIQVDFFHAAEFNQYIQAKRDYLTAHGDRKRSLRAQIDAVKRQVSAWVRHGQASRGFDWAVEFAEVFLDQTSPTTLRGGFAGILNQTGGQMELAQQARQTFGGFDIVLANPPYIRQEVITRELGAEYKQLLMGLYPRDYVGTADLYVAFYARAQQLLRQGGTACFISSNKWLRAGYGEKLRQHLLDSQMFHLVLDFGELPVFQAAATFPAVFLWQRQPRASRPTLWSVVKDLEACYEEGILSYVRRTAVAVPHQQFGAGKPRLVHPASAALMERMEASGPRLKEYVKDQIFRGVLTGLNEAFIIDAPTRQALIERDPRSAEIIKPLLVGDDVRRYEAHFRERYLIFTCHGISIEKFPAILEHLKKYQKDLTPKKNSNDTRGRKPGSYEWYEIQDTVDYYAAFDAPKIIYPEIAREVRFYLDDDGMYPLKTVFSIPYEDWYLLSVLNSSAAFEYLKVVCSVLGDEENGGRLTLQTIFTERLPIPLVSDINRAKMIQLAKQAQSLHRQRRARVETFLQAVGLPPARSTSRNPLEQPWALNLEDFRHRLPGAEARLFTSAREETLALTEQIAKVEAEIDARAASLYGLE